MNALNNEAITLYAAGTDLVAIRLDEGNYITALGFGQLSASLSPMVGGACIIRGASMSEEARKMTAEALADILRETYPTITLAEVGKAIKQGSYGIYGEVYGVNAASLYKMVVGYMESEEKAALNKAVAARREQKQSSQYAANAAWLAAHPDYKRSTL